MDAMTAENIKIGLTEDAKSASARACADAGLAPRGGAVDQVLLLICP